MNFTYLFSCSCEYQQVVHQKKGESLMQCPACLAVNSKKTQKTVTIVCKACDHHEHISISASFYTEEELKKGEKSCKNCQLKGLIGADIHQRDLFYVEYEEMVSEPCDRCHKNRWNELAEKDSVANKTEPFRCASCFKRNMEKEMSSFWEEEA